MPTTLPILGAAVPDADAWAAFVARRDSLTAQMELSTCYGCDDCGLRCMDGITVTRGEYNAAVTFVAQWPTEETTRIGYEAKTTPWPGAEDTGATVTWCRYRDHEKGNCSIYAVRPTVCRLFGHVPWLPCPTGAVGKTPEDAGAVWDTYRALERRTWSEWDRIVAEGYREIGGFTRGGES